MKFDVDVFIRQLPTMISLGIIPIDILRENGICNGCTMVLQRWWSTGYISPLCDMHDLCYFIGGTAEDKVFIDEQLRQAILEHGRGMGNWLTRPFHIFLSKGIAAEYYEGVRLFGRKFYNYQKESILTHEQIITLYTIALENSKGFKLTDGVRKI